jgi:hypothetical protein
MNTDWTAERYASAVAATAHRLLAAAEDIRGAGGSGIVAQGVEEVHGLVGEIQHLAPPAVPEPQL